MSSLSKIEDGVYDKQMTIDAICGTEVDERTSEILVRHQFRKLLHFGEQSTWNREFLEKKTFAELKQLYLRLRSGFLLKGD